MRRHQLRLLRARSRPRLPRSPPRPSRRCSPSFRNKVLITLRIRANDALDKSTTPLEREKDEFIQWAPRYGSYAISPMLNWTRKDVGLYMKQHDLPYHPLIEKGYLSIGCNPLSCTPNSSVY